MVSDISQPAPLVFGSRTTKYIQISGQAAVMTNGLFFAGEICHA